MSEIDPELYKIEINSNPEQFSPEQSKLMRRIGNRVLCVARAFAHVTGVPVLLSAYHESQEYIANNPDEAKNLPPFIR